MEEELISVCFNCNHFFPASLGEPTEFGVCLLDEAFEKFIDEILGDCKGPSCEKLVENKKFSGDNDACDDFEEVEEGIEIDDNSPLGLALSGLIGKEDITKESLEEALWEEQIKQMGLKNLEVDQYLEKLNNPDPQKQKKAVTSLKGLIALDNEKAYEVLFLNFKNLFPPETIKDVHFTIDVFKCLNKSDRITLLIPVLIDKLYQTPSNNTTRQWINEIFQFFESCPLVDVRDPLENMLKSKKFSYRLKQKMKLILSQ